MTKNCAIVVQARMSSSRLPGKSLASIGEKPLLYYVIKHLQHSEYPVIVATSDHPSDNILVEFLKAEGIEFFRGDLQNVFRRYLDCADYFKLDAVIRVTGDNPLVDLLALERAKNLFIHFDYLDGIYANGWIKGSGFEFFKLQALKDAKILNKDHKEHVTLALREEVNFRGDYKKLEIPDHQKFENKIALTCDYPEDLKLLRQIFKRFDYSTSISISEVISLYENNPSLFKPSAALHYSHGKDPSS